MNGTKPAEDNRTKVYQDAEFQKALGVLTDGMPESDIEPVREGLYEWLRVAIKGEATKPAHVVKSINQEIAEIDALISAQVNEILHHSSFQNLEASWRGLEGLVLNSAPVAGRLEIKVLNISKEELVDHLNEYKGKDLIQESPLYEKLYRKNLGILGGAPIGCMVGDFYFDHNTEDVVALEGMSKLAATCLAPFITSAKPELFGAKKWADLEKKSDKAIYNYFQTDQKHNKWRSLRGSDDACFLGLTAFRVLGREPYSKSKSFVFQEGVDGAVENYVWVNSAFAMAENIAAAFFKYDWPVQIRGLEGGGLLKRLPQHVLDTDPENPVGPAELSTPYERETIFDKLGFLPFLGIQNSSDAVFQGAQSMQDPKVYFGPEGEYASANAELHARLPYIFAACRIQHFVCRLAQRKIGSLLEAAALQRYLQDWLNQYILPTPDDASEDERRRKPLREGKVTATPVKGKPGYYDIKIEVRPHFQFEGAEIDVSLVSRVGKEKK
jgi:type VI secretion system protein ImpC